MKLSFMFGQDTKLILVSDCYLGFEQEHSIEQRPARR